MLVMWQARKAPINSPDARSTVNSLNSQYSQKCENPHNDSGPRVVVVGRCAFASMLCLVAALLLAVAPLGGAQYTVWNGELAEGVSLVVEFADAQRGNSAQRVRHSQLQRHRCGPVRRTHSRHNVRAPHGLRLCWAFCRASSMSLIHARPAGATRCPRPVLSVTATTRSSACGSSAAARLSRPP